MYLYSRIVRLTINCSICTDSWQFHKSQYNSLLEICNCITKTIASNRWNPVSIDGYNFLCHAKFSMFYNVILYLLITVIIKYSVENFFQNGTIKFVWMRWTNNGMKCWPIEFNFVLNINSNIFYKDWCVA